MLLHISLIINTYFLYEIYMTLVEIIDPFVAIFHLIWRTLIGRRLHGKNPFVMMGMIFKEISHDNKC